MANAGEVIREFRTKANLSLEEVAAALKVTAGAVGHWENGRFSPRRAVALRLDTLLGADGRITSALGYALPRDVAGELADLRARVELLERRVGAMTLTNQQFAAERLSSIEEHLARLEPDAVVKPLRRAAKKKTPPTPD